MKHILYFELIREDHNSDSSKNLPYHNLDF